MDIYDVLMAKAIGVITKDDYREYIQYNRFGDIF